MSPEHIWLAVVFSFVNMLDGIMAAAVSHGPHP